MDEWLAGWVGMCRLRGGGQRDTRRCWALGFRHLGRACPLPCCCWWTRLPAVPSALHDLFLLPQSWEDVYFFCGRTYQNCTASFRWNGGWVLCQGQGQVDLPACWLSWVHGGWLLAGVCGSALQKRQPPFVLPLPPIAAAGSRLLCSGTLSSPPRCCSRSLWSRSAWAACCQVRLRSSWPGAVAGSTAHQQPAAPLHGRG